VDEEGVDADKRIVSVWNSCQLMRFFKEVHTCDLENWKMIISDLILEIMKILKIV